MKEGDKIDFIIIKKEQIQFLDSKGITNGKEIMLFAKLVALCGKTNTCTPSNKYLSNLLCCSERNIRNYLKNLKGKGVIKITEIKIDKDLSKRIIQITL